MWIKITHCVDTFSSLNSKGVQKCLKLVLIVNDLRLAPLLTTVNPGHRSGRDRAHQGE